MSESGGGERRQKWLKQYAPVLALYCVATLLTDAYFMGDTLRYVDSIEAHFNGKYFNFWEFGHLFWRPLAYLCSRLFYPLTQVFVGSDLRLNVTLTLVALNWLAGVPCVIALTALVRRFCKREWIVIFVTVAFICANSFLNYFHTGCSYTIGLSFLLAGFYLLLKEEDTGSRSTAILAGASLACAVCFWLPYILSLPAILVAPLVLFGYDKRRLRLILHTCLVCALVGFASYVGVAVFALGIRDAAGFKAWFADASHGIVNMGGLPRAVFGFARSFINMGDDGRVFKRYVLRDPFNPVSLLDLFRLGLWKFVFFYAAMLALGVSLLRSQTGRRLLALLLLAGVPLFAFAIFLFDAGQIERYLPLYPFIVLAFAHVLGSERANGRTGRALKYFLLAYLAVMIVVNLSAMSRPALESRKKTAEARTKDLWPWLKPESRVFASHIHDEMVNNYINYVFDPVEHNDQMAFVLDPNTPFILHWRQNFSVYALSVWKKGGDVWLSKRLFSPRPRPEWNWVEGDDPRVSWTDLSNFFSRFETGHPVGGEDGFVQLLPSSENERRLNAFAQNDQE
jgi:general stress protein CsbA